MIVFGRGSPALRQSKRACASAPASATIERVWLAASQRWMVRLGRENNEATDSAGRAIDRSAVPINSSADESRHSESALSHSMPSYGTLQSRQLRPGLGESGWAT